MASAVCTKCGEKFENDHAEKSLKMHMMRVHTRAGKQGQKKAIATAKKKAKERAKLASAMSPQAIRRARERAEREAGTNGTTKTKSHSKTCDLCGKKFKNPFGVAIHKATMHKGESRNGSSPEHNGNSNAQVDARGWYSIGHVCAQVQPLVAAVSERDSIPQSLLAEGIVRALRPETRGRIDRARQ